MARTELQGMKIQLSKAPKHFFRLQPPARNTYTTGLWHTWTSKWRLQLWGHVKPLYTPILQDGYKLFQSDIRAAEAPHLLGCPTHSTMIGVENLRVQFRFKMLDRLAARKSRTNAYRPQGDDSMVEGFNSPLIQLLCLCEQENGREVFLPFVLYALLDKCPHNHRCLSLWTHVSKINLYFGTTHTGITIDPSSYQAQLQAKMCKLHNWWSYTKRRKGQEQ